MNEHTLQILEFPKVVNLIRGQCLTPYGTTIVEKIRPIFDKIEIDRRLDDVSQMRDIISFGLPFPLCRMDDVTALLKKSQVPEGFLEPKEILAVGDLVSVSAQLNKYDKDGRDKFPNISEYLDRIRAFPEMSAEINRAIGDDAEVKDSASSRLKSIRNELISSRQRITSRLQQIIARQTKQSGWQDDIVTIRNERYVIGVPTNTYSSNMGILHDRSQTGATLYVEPPEAVELNNRINILYQEEREEIVRILKVLSAEIGRRAEPLLENTSLIGQLDALHACAQFSLKTGGQRPVIVDTPSFALKNARHPLLIVQMGGWDKVVPNSIDLDGDRHAILVTGPNTGGKTVILKTVGLSVAMAQSGLHISADERSEVGIFSDIFADIGDEQSIEMSLSTFSSHIRNIIEGLTNAAEDVLLLFDEIGAGTDPKEGSALAEAIIHHTIERKARLIVTTHYSQLKSLAMDFPQLENASLDFDRKSLAPTYQLKLGLPGSSYAVEIASRLGMPESITRRASSLLSSGEKSLDRLIRSLEEELKEVKKDQVELRERLETARQLEALYREQTDRLKKEANEEKEKALAGTKEFLDNTRRAIEKLVAEIRKSQASKKSVRDFHRVLKASEEAVRNLRKKGKVKPEAPREFRIGDHVEIITLNQSGEISELVGKDRARIKVGNIFTTVPLRDLTISSDKPVSPARKSPAVSYERDDAISREIHLRGMTVEEAKEALDRFLDRAVVAGLHQVYVVHGKGTGVLRRQLTQYLKEHPEVDSIRLGNWNEGGAGVTIVKLKE